MQRRIFLKACGAALAACAGKVTSAKMQTGTPTYPIHLPIIANGSTVATANGSPLPYSADFMKLPDGAPLPAAFHAPTWTVSGGAANNAPPLANQLHPNGSMEAGNPPTTYYVNGTNTAVSSYADQDPGGRGTHCQRMELKTGSTSGGSQVNPPVTAAPGDWFHSEVWLKNGDLSTGLMPLLAASDGTPLAIGDFHAAPTWAQQVLTAQTPDAALIERVGITGSATQCGYVDDYFCYRLAPQDLLATIRGAADYCCSVRSNEASYMRQFGLVLNCDDPNHPLNYLLVWYDRLNNRVSVDEYRNGVMTNCLRAPEANNFAYLALTAVKTGSKLDVYWGGTRLTPTPLTVNPALTHNTYLGFMAPYGGGVVKFNAAPAAVTKNILCYGDSKFVRDNPGIVKQLTGGPLIAVESPARIAVSGRSTAGSRAALTSELAAAQGTPDYIFYNLGANDGGMTETAWKTDTAAILDGLHAKWPAAKIYIARAWIRGGDVQADNRAAWLETLLPARAAWAFRGPDERIFLENGDNGVSLTTDGAHPNALGEYRTAQEWRKCIGYE